MAFPTAFPSTTGAASRSNFETKERRFGTIAARIYSDHRHKQSINTPTAASGSSPYFVVQDPTRHPEDAKHAKWCCQHASCAGKCWATKSDLLAAHEDNRVLKQKQEIHLYYAASELPAIEGRPEKRDSKGELVHEAVEAKPARVILFSDEE